MRSKAGFSLLEVLAALAVTTLLMVAFTPFVGQFLRTWARGSEVATAVELRTRGLRALREDLRHAVMWSGYGKKEDLLTFRGMGTSLSFPAAAGLGGRGEGLEMLSITLAGTADGWSLVRKRADIVGNTYGAFTSAVVLFSGPYKYFFTYRSGAGQEMESWTDSTALPRSVMLHMVDRRKPLASLTIEIPVLASMSAACLANSALPGCPALPAPESADLAKQFGFGPGTQ